MALKATAQITLSSVIDVKATYRYYRLQSSTLAKPAKPSTFPPASTWGDVEPNYVDGSTNTLYFVDCTVFCDDTFNYSEVSLSSAYEAAKAAYNKAVNAENTASNAKKDVASLSLTVDQHTEQIAARATKAELESAISVSAGEIVSTVRRDYDKTASRGEQLVTNGNCLLGDNTNFSKLTFDGAVSNNSPGSFTYTRGKMIFVNSDEFIPVNTAKRYTLSFDAKTSNGSATLFAYLSFYDVDKLEIHSSNHTYGPGTLTTLSQDLNNGDTLIHVTDASKFQQKYAYTTVRFWSYANSFGYTYPPETYTRFEAAVPIENNTPSDGAIDYVNNTVQLLAPWDGGTIKSGTFVSQGVRGNGYKYIIAGKQPPTEWTTYEASIAGVDYSGGDVLTMFPPGVAYAKVSFILNTQTVDDQLWLTNISLTDSTATKELVDQINTTESSLGDRIDATDTKIDAIKIGARNLVRNSESLIYEDYICTTGNIDANGDVVTREAPENEPLEVVSNIATTDSGVSQLTLTHLGKNLLKYPYYDKSRTVNGVTFTVNSDGSITINGTATASTSFRLAGAGVAANAASLPRWIIPGETYFLSPVIGMPSGARLLIYFYNQANTNLGYISAQYGTAGTVPAETVKYYALITINKGVTVDQTIYPMLERGNVGTAHAPYKCEERTITIDPPVNGGAFNWTTGLLTDSNGQEYQYTPQPVTAFSGANTFYSSTGDTAIVLPKVSMSPVTIEAANGSEDTCASIVVNEAPGDLTLTGVASVSSEYTLSFWVKSDTASSMTVLGSAIPTSPTWQRYTVTFTAESEDIVLYFETAGTYYLYHTQLEVGNKATDWTPAPEDVDGDIAEVQDAADDASTRIGAAESQIKQLSDSIVTVVTDADGKTRMIQTSTGWEFGTTELKNRVDKTANDFEELNTYVRIGEYDPGDGNPVEACIDLGVSENALTAKITNTRMEYANGPTPLVTIDSEKQSLEAGIVEVHNYQQFGDESNPEVTGVWQWQRRSNGNLGLSWKEVIN